MRFHSKPNEIKNVITDIPKGKKMDQYVRCLGNKFKVKQYEFVYENSTNVVLNLEATLVGSFRFDDTKKTFDFQGNTWKIDTCQLDNLLDSIDVLITAHSIPKEKHMSTIIGLDSIKCSDIEKVFATSYIKQPFTPYYNYYDGHNIKPRNRKIPEIKNVIFNDPATIVFWADGTKTVVKKQKEDKKKKFDKEKGLVMAIAKKALSNEGNYFNEIKKWVE